ncbi:protein FAM210B, mitochondrial-like [Amphibalanus amphitrite]|uniref:protein FAM210B, mitochondrial-like n=1 Tax=Amphibalanus amphitrite TaxID=1232801 RepID=UPI001C92364B|nr:protein FAM210B, mitochondrial-like [Amphibalanus amphitrite]XP_043188912.1 protein FAM210B, mitochondrial-like [Amphibalanus amphitrite]XP_043188913.1 protein FAM210B, mitochondrial-like [Amphibalanus amphitrite]XP_043207035.1 protein FAM210B, mitochondrial-like [Amphibalanus amphitrite]XP_043207036.1 protein FAM210B, mitochondrial-like [Amphibalanus amphitrite]XP_043207037.1 protein FAM210B, mitochondrial-like [Amphibalanus amphitrite]
MTNIIKCRMVMFGRIGKELAVQGTESLQLSSARHLCTFTPALATLRTSHGHRNSLVKLHQTSHSAAFSGTLATLPLPSSQPPPTVWTRGLHASRARLDDDREPPPAQLNQRQRLRLAVRDYGATVVVFHVTISLASLGFFYVAVKSGLDVVAMLRWLGLGDSIAQSKIVTGGSTFVLAYAVHKVFAPARIATTLGCTPFIVRYLRRRGLLRSPPPRVD